MFDESISPLLISPPQPRNSSLQSRGPKERMEAVYEEFAAPTTKESAATSKSSLGGVLDIPELLESMLLNASPTDLLMWQRVNRLWRAAIQRSPRIQEKLFLRSPSDGDSRRQHVIQNPFLDLFVERSTFGNILLVEHLLKEKARHPEALWRQMFITTPAIVELEIRVTGSRVEWEVDYRWSIVREGGITLGQLLDVQEEAKCILKVFEDLTDIEVSLSYS